MPGTSLSGDVFNERRAPCSWRILRIARGIARFNPCRSLGKFFRNLAQRLGGAFFRFRRDFFLYKTLHAVEFFVNSLAKILEILDVLEPREFFINARAELLDFVHKCHTPRKNRLKEKKRGDLGIIGTRFAGRKEESWRFPTGGSGAWKNGNRQCADFSPATTNPRPNSARPAYPWP